MSGEDKEQAWLTGNRAAWRSMLGECLKHLGYNTDEAQRVSWITEREDIIAMLRQICEEHGDNDWPNNLHLGDVIEKHLWRHLE